jgi:hypothetical protein
MRKRARQPKPEMLGEILRKILKKRNIPHTPKDRHLIEIWKQAVGPQVALQTHPDTLKRGTLFIRVSAPVWMHQLQFLKEEILERLKQISGSEEIRTLQFSIGELPSPFPATGGQPAADVALPPLAGRDRDMMRRCLETIRDPQLKEILERVMAREISRRRQREKRRAPGR